MPHQQRRLGLAVAAAGVLFVASMTLFPSPQPSIIPLSCLICGERAGVDTILNVLLFIPLGLGLALAGFSGRRTVVLAALVSLFVEVMQLQFIAGRDASIGDLITNTTGGAVGAFLGLHWQALVFPHRRRALPLAVAWGAGMVLVWACTAWALAPQWPHDLPWLGQWAPELEYFDRFDGKVLMATAAGEALPPGLPINQGRFEAAISGRPDIGVRAVLGAPSSRIAPIGAVMDEWSRTLVLLGQEGQDLVFRVRMRSVLLRLRNPIVALPRAFAGMPGDTVDAEGALRNGVFELSVRNGDRLRTRSLPLSASWGWSLVLPWDYALGTEAHLLTGLWIVGLVGVLAYWGMVAGVMGWMGSLGTAIFLLTGIPRFFGLPSAHWSEWVAAGFGLLLGGVAARWARASIPAIGHEEIRSTAVSDPQIDEA